MRRLTAALIALAALVAGCRSNGAKAHETTVATFAREAAEADATHYTAEYSLTADANVKPMMLAVVRRPPAFRYALTGGPAPDTYAVVDTGRATYVCGSPARCRVLTDANRSGASLINVFSPDAILMRLRIIVATTINPRTVARSTRTVDDRSSQCITAKVGDLNPTPETYCIDAHGVVTYASRDDSKIELRRYSRDVDPKAFVLPASGG